MRWLDGITDLMGHEFEQALGVGDRQGVQRCTTVHGVTELNLTEQLN